MRREREHAAGLASLWQLVRSRSNRNQADLAHDFQHLRRVWRNALDIATRDAPREEWSVDLDVLEAACALHDIGRGHEHGTEHHAETSARLADELLRVRGLDDLVWPVCEAILSHSSSQKREPASTEAAILRDADRLDALGAIGVARALLSGAHRGTPSLYSPEDPGARERQHDDRSWVMDHFPAKLFTLEEGMCTPTGKREARRRAGLVRAFHEALVLEVGSGAVRE